MTMLSAIKGTVVQMQANNRMSSCHFATWVCCLAEIVAAKAYWVVD